MKKILLIVLSASLLLCSCGKTENGEINNKTNNWVSDKIDTSDSSLEDIDVTVDYIGNTSDNNNGEVNFILSNPTSEEGFLVGTYKFENIEHFVPAKKTNIEDYYFEDIVDVAEDRTISMDKKDTDVWTEVSISDEIWGNESDRVASDYSVSIQVEDSLWYSDLVGFDYIESRNTREDIIEYYQYKDYYMSIYQTDSYVFYDAFFFVEGFEDVVSIKISAVADKIDKSKVDMILDNLSIELVPSIDNLDKSKYYLEDEVAKRVAEDFDISLKKPFMIVESDNSSIVYAEKVEDGYADKTELKIDFLTPEPEEEYLVETIGRYKICFDGDYEFFYEVDDKYYRIDFSNDSLTIDELKEKYFS